MNVFLIIFFFFCLDLESEMYQLSHLLIEQRNTLSTLREESLLEDQKHLITEQQDINCKMLFKKKIIQCY